jgi:predicted AAA+ superfamily ATPase
MQRFFDDFLLHWKDKPHRKPLIIRGARQVGKTYTVTVFAKKYFTHFLNVNFERYPELKTVFKNTSPSMILAELSAYFSIPIKPGETLLFLDEIQHCPNALTALRYFYEEIPNLHIIAAGSLLDHYLNDTRYSMPVGRVEFGYMYPLTFGEFLIALGEHGLWKYLLDYNLSSPFSQALHTKLKELLRLYYFIGGMPEAVKVYIETGDLAAVEQVHESILTSLQYDFARYGTKKEQEILRDSLQYLARNIGKKVKYSHINPYLSAKIIKSALFKLEMSRIIHLVRRTRSVNVPINQMIVANDFKPLFLDIGLANHLSGIRLIEIQDLVTAYEGTLAEQFVGQQLIAALSHHYLDAKLYYWKREEKNANAEIDYLLQLRNKIVPVEVKAGKTGSLKSLHVFLAQYEKNFAIRFNADLPSVGKNLQAKINVKDRIVEVVFNLISLPLYMAELVDKVCELGR